MKYCIYLRKRKNKPYCNLRKESIELAECRNCSNKVYKKSTYNRKSPIASGQMKNKSKKDKNRKE